VFKAYMDETGLQRHDPYCVIAGYVGDVREWDTVERKWKFVLEDFKVAYFHSLEFYGNDEKQLYVGWKPSKRLAFQNALFDCLRDSNLYCCSAIAPRKRNKDLSSIVASRLYDKLQQ
jgi:hypothetical protein